MLLFISTRSRTGMMRIVRAAVAWAQPDLVQDLMRDRRAGAVGAADFRSVVAVVGHIAFSLHSSNSSSGVVWLPLVSPGGRAAWQRERCVRRGCEFLARDPCRSQRFVISARPWIH